MSQEVLLTVMNSMSLIGDIMNMDGKRNESCDKCVNLEAELLKSQNAFNDLLKRHSQLEKHCISLECSIQLNQEIFQKRESCDNQNALEIPELFAINDLKAQLQDKNSTICKLNDIIKSIREKSKDKNFNYDYVKIETKNDFKEQFDSIKRTRFCSKERGDSLIDKLNLKSAKNEDLKAQIQDKVFVITSLKNDLRRIKGKEIVDIATQKPFANTIVPGMFKELLVYVQDTCPNAIKPSAKKVAVTPKNKVKKVRFAEPLTSSSNIKQSKLNANSELMCATCKKYMFNGVHDMCLLDFVKKVNSLAKSAKKHKKQNIWKPTGHVFTEVGFKWQPTGGTFTIVGNRSQLMNFVSKFLGVDLIFGSRDTNLYTISLDDMLKTSPICLLSKASKTKSWLWHRWLSHLNFGTLNKLAKDGLARAMASEQLSLGPGLQCMTLATSSSGLVPNTVSQQPCIPPNRDDWDHLFQTMFDEYFNPPSIYVSTVPVTAAPRAVDLVDSLVSTSIDQDTPITSIPSTQEQEHSPIISQGAVDPTLFTRKAGNNLLLVQIYVDDIIFESTNAAMCNEFANQMTTKLKMSMMGQMSFFLGLQISQSPRGIFINQSKYASEIVKKYGMLTTDSIDTPFVENSKLNEDLHGKPVDATLYRGMIGSLMYLTSSRPDLIHAVCLCARYQAKPTEKHLEAIPLYCDNKSAITLCCNNVQHSRGKHIDVHYHFIKKQVENRIVELYFLTTQTTTAALSIENDSLFEGERMSNFFFKVIKDKIANNKYLRIVVESLGTNCAFSKTRNMNPIATQQVALDNALVPYEKTLKIERCNARIAFTKPQKEETYQVSLEALKLSPCYPAFQITVEEDFMYQADNRKISSERKEHIPYPRFTKVIINHIISKDNTISMRNRINLHTILDDSLLGTLKFVAKTKDCQKYGALIPNGMINQNVKDSKPYKTYYNFATGKVEPKKARKFKKPASPKLKTLPSSTKEHIQKGKLVKKSAKKTFTTSTVRVVIRDTPDVSISKKKGPGKADRGKGIDEEESDDVNEEDKNYDENEENDSDNDDGDNVDGDNDDGGNDDEGEDQQNASHESGFVQEEEEDAHVTLTTVHDKTESPLQSSSISSDFTSKLLNLDDPSSDINSMTNTSTVPPPPLLVYPSSHPTTIPQQQTPDSTTTTTNPIMTLPKIPNFASANQPQMSYVVAASLSEFELKKILIDKMENNKSINRSDIQKNLYNALVESHNTDKDILSTYVDVVTLKRG
uniref:Retrovirus-related Pol polyprotein from transposon TNT 1-94 n=1 Tax=Tanacetum cinerariifolium TaxID=118510 RepID=A0A6L2J3E0_TANCI|nr:retrovirus-related Pol polyprotein from transposon TNT 1-94 [Tanacetum cinerariifolium]